MSMIKAGKRAMVYAKLPEELQGKNTAQAKLDVALNMTVPEELRKKADKELNDLHEIIEDEFKKWVKKVSKKYLEED